MKGECGSNDSKDVPNEEELTFELIEHIMKRYKKVIIGETEIRFLTQKIDLDDTEAVKKYFSHIANMYGDEFVFYEEPKGDTIGQYNGIPILITGKDKK